MEANRFEVVVAAELAAQSAEQVDAEVGMADRGPFECDQKLYCWPRGLEEIGMGDYGRIGDELFDDYECGEEKVMDQGLHFEWRKEGKSKGIACQRQTFECKMWAKTNKVKWECPSLISLNNPIYSEPSKLKPTLPNIIALDQRPVDFVCKP